MDGDGQLTRRYLDTGREGAVPVRIDAQGTARVGGNRTLQSVLAHGAPQTYRGAPALPEHLQRAIDHMMLASDVEDLARRCGVKRTTAWNYLCRIVDARPDARVRAVRFVQPEIVHELGRVDARGSLREVADRMRLKTTHDDLFSQLRLARLCVG